MYPLNTEYQYGTSLKPTIFSLFCWFQYCYIRI